MKIKRFISVLLVAVCLIAGYNLIISYAASNAPAAPASEAAHTKAAVTDQNDIVYEGASLLSSADSSPSALRLTALDTSSSSAVAAQLASGNVDTSKLQPGSYVTPEQFGAQGDGVTNDSQAFIKMFDEIDRLTFSIESKEKRGVFNITAPLCILRAGATYNIVNTIHVPCSYLKIIGNGAKIISNTQYRVFMFDVFDNGRSSGWQTEFDNISFVNCKEPIWFGYKNLEAGKIIINQCRFHECTGYAITTNRRSCTVVIKDSTFTGCDRYWSSNCNDLSVFENNWASYYVLTDSEKTPIKLTRTEAPTDEFSCRIVNNIFVPTTNSMLQGRAWIYCDVPDMTIQGNRFGGEAGSMPVINVAPGMSVDNVSLPEESSCVRIINNYTANGDDRLINLIGLPTLIEVTGNRGFYGHTTAVGWDSSVSASKQKKLINAAEYLKIIMFGNSGYHVDNKRFWDEIASNVPENLVPYVNNIASSSKLSSDTEYKLELASSQVDELTETNESLIKRVAELEAENEALKKSSKSSGTQSDQFDEYKNDLLRLDVNSDGMIDAVDASVIQWIYAFNSANKKPLTTFDDLKKEGIVK